MSNPVSQLRLKVVGARFICLVLLNILLFGGLPIIVLAQEPVENSGETHSSSTLSKEDVPAAPAKVDVNPVAHDGEISKRLQSVLNATK